MVLPRNFPAKELHAGGILPRASTGSLKEDLANVNRRIDTLHKDLMSKIQHLLDIHNTLSSGKNETAPAIDATSAHCDLQSPV